MNNKRLRIALLMHGGLAPYNEGVHVHHLVETVRNLSRHVDVDVFTLQSQGLPNSDFRVGSARVTVLPLDARDSLWITAIQLATSVIRSHRKVPYDIVHGFWGLPGGLASYIASRILFRPNVISFLGGETASLSRIGYGGMLRARSRLLIKYLVSHADLLHFLSRFQLFQSQRRQLRPRQTVVIPFGIEDVRPLKPTAKLARRKKTIIHVANLTEVKDQETLLKSFQIIRKAIDAELVIVGGDYLQSRLQHAVARLKLGHVVRFTGHIAHTDVLSLISKADLMLHCSLHEAQGMVLLEAAALGIPIVATRVGFGWDWEGYSCDSVDPGDFEGVACKALFALRESEMHKYFVHKGLGISSKLTVEESNRQLIYAYRGLIRRVK